MATEKRTIALLVAALSLTAMFAATATQEAHAALSPQESRERVEGRQSHMREHAVALYNIERYLKASPTNWVQADINAQQFRANTRDMASWFAPGTGSKSGASTAARPEIWAKPELFRHNREALQAQAEKLLAAVQAKDLVQAKLQYNATAAVCTACHLQFRAEQRIQKFP